MPEANNTPQKISSLGDATMSDISSLTLQVQQLGESANWWSNTSMWLMGAIAFVTLLYFGASYKALKLGSALNTARDTLENEKDRALALRIMRQESPRWALLSPLDAALEGKPRGSVEIVFVPDNDEAHKTAMWLESALTGWKIVKNARPILPNDSELILPQFATPEMAKNHFNLPLITRIGGWGDFTVIASPADLSDDGFPRAETAANAVLFGLMKCGFQPLHNVDARLAAGNVRIIVGPRQ